MPRRCVIYMPQMPNSHECIHTYGNKRYRGCVIHIGVGLLRCSFRQDGQFSGASNREASDSAGLHAFLCLDREYTITLWLSEARYPAYLMWERYGADR